MKLKLDQSGFTAVEAIIVTALFVVVSLVLMSLYDGYNKTFFSQQALITTSDSARLAMNAIGTSVLQSNAVLATSSLSSTLYTSATTTMVLQLPSVDSSGNIVSGKSDYVVFYQSGTKLYQLQQSDASSVRRSFTKQLTDTLSTISFTYNNSDFTQVSYVTMDLKTQSQVFRQTLKSHLNQQFNLRNY